MALSKILTQNIHTVFLLFVRSLAGVCILIPFLYKNRQLRPKYPKLQMRRFLFGACAMYATYYAYRNLPLAFATSIGFSGPLFTTVLAFFILKEVVTVKEWMLVVMGYIGVLIVINPSGIAFDPAIFSLIMANIFASLVIITTKRIPTDEAKSITLFYTAAGILLVSSFCVVPFWTTVSWMDFLVLIGMGILATCAQWAYVSALQCDNASFLAPFEYTRLIVSIPIGYIFFSENFTFADAVGSLIIIVMTLLMSRAKKQ